MIRVEHSTSLAGRFIASGQPCCCFSKSSARTSDDRATATDSAISSSGTSSPVAKDSATQIAFSESNVNLDTSQAVDIGAGSTLSIGVGGADLASLLGEVTRASTEQISSLATALAPRPANSDAVERPKKSEPAQPSAGFNRNDIMLAAAVVAGLIVLNKSIK